MYKSAIQRAQFAADHKQSVIETYLGAWEVLDRGGGFGVKGELTPYCH